MGACTAAGSLQFSMLQVHWFQDSSASRQHAMLAALRPTFEHMHSLHSLMIRRPNRTDCLAERKPARCKLTRYCNLCQSVEPAQVDVPTSASHLEQYTRPATGVTMLLRMQTVILARKSVRLVQSKGAFSCCSCGSDSENAEATLPHVSFSCITWAHPEGATSVSVFLVHVGGQN